MFGMSSSPVIPVVLLLFAGVSIWYSTKTEWIRRASETRVRWNRRVYGGSPIDVDGNVLMTRVVCFLMAAICVGVVVLWVVKGLLGNLE